VDEAVKAAESPRPESPKPSTPESNKAV
jgi:hypothetical protein